MLSARTCLNSWGGAQHSVRLFSGSRRLCRKIRRIIDEWGTGVKRKISLSFKGIINLTRSAEGMRGGLQHGNPWAPPRRFWNTCQGVIGAVSSVQTTPRVYGATDGGLGSYPSMGQLRVLEDSRRWRRRLIDRDPHIIAVDTHREAAHMTIRIGETLSGGDVEGPEVPRATDDLALD